MSAQYKGLLKWVAENVCEINTLQTTKSGQERVELIYWLSDLDDTDVVTGAGNDIFEAFIQAMNKARDKQAIKAAVKKMPRRFVRRFAETTVNPKYYGKHVIKHK